MKIPSRSAVGLIVAVLFALSSMACGGGGDGSGPMSPTGPSTPMIVFTPDRAAGANSIGLRSGAGSLSTVLQLELFATEVVGVQAVDFTLLFPNDLLTFTGFLPGDFIGVGAQVTPGPGSGAGALSFQILRTAPSAATGSGPIMILNFNAAASGNGRFDLIDRDAEDVFGLSIPGIDWIGGSVVVVR